MTEAEEHLYMDQLARIRTDFEGFKRFALDGDRWAFARRIWKQMAADPDEAVWARLPATIRDMINKNLRTAWHDHHRFLGEGVGNLSSSFDVHRDSRLLLRLCHDDMQLWTFTPDMHLQYWITPKALAAQDWDAVQIGNEDR